MAKPTTLTDLPPELIDHIASYLPTAQSLSHLAQTSQSLNAYVEKDAWQSFAKARFSSLYPYTTPGPGKDVAHTLTSLSRAWDRRAFLSKYTEPWGEIHAFPGNRKIDRWKRPRGQTIGFTPQLDCFEQFGSNWRERREVLAFSAGAEVCVRERRIGGYAGVEDDDIRWMTYRPLEASEGKDDITTLRLLRPDGTNSGSNQVEMITGTANGHLKLVRLSNASDGNVVARNFTTHGRPVRSSSLLQEQWKPTLLAANVGDTRLCLYPVDGDASTAESTSEVELRRPSNGHRTYRAWSTNFLSATHLAVGLGPSEEPVHVYELSPSGLSKDPIRKFGLQNDLDRLEGEITLSGFARKSTSSVYPIVPLPPSSGTSATSGISIFLSGAYDGIIRLHDLRSDRDVEQAYIDSTDDSAIYSLLPRGHETLVAGTSRHTLLKVFDLRLGARAYSYLDASPPSNQPDQQHNPTHETKDWNLFLKPNSATYPGRGGGNNWARRSAESSIYTLASPSHHSPYIYAGVENAVVEMAFTSSMGRRDPTFFGTLEGKKGSLVKGFRDKEVLDLAMYDQDAGLKLLTQMSLWETARASGEARLPGLDERWKIGS